MTIAVLTTFVVNSFQFDLQCLCSSLPSRQLLVHHTLDFGAKLFQCSTNNLVSLSRLTFNMCTLTLFAVSLLCVVSHAVSDHNDVGVMIWPDDEMDSKLSPKSARRLISSSSCASGSTSGCSSSNPAGCPCPAFTDDERTQILDLHNYRRELAASGNEVCASSGGFSTQSCPAGTDMNALLWDEQLETIATYWAHQFGRDLILYF